MNSELEENPLRDRLLLPKNWSDALAALQGHQAEGIRWRYVGKHDPKPLGALLGGSEPIPQYVRETLSRLLAPPKGYQGGKLIYKKPGTRSIKLEERHRTEMEAKRYIYELMYVKEPRLMFEAAVYYASEKYGWSIGWAKNLKALTQEELFSKLSEGHDPGTLLP
jgi:hypothetical protein